VRLESKCSGDGVIRTDPWTLSIDELAVEIASRAFLNSPHLPPTHGWGGVSPSGVEKKPARWGRWMRKKDRRLAANQLLVWTNTLPPPSNPGGWGILGPKEGPGRSSPAAATGWSPRPWPPDRWRAGRGAPRRGKKNTEEL